MKRTISISRRAELDLTHQYRWFLDQAGVEVAERFLHSFDSSVSRLAKLPSLGRIRRFRSPLLAGIRSWAVGGSFRFYLVFYRATDNELSIERVIHGGRDLERRLLESSES
jgi:plasmid stabilization system protein ParE